MSYDDAYASNYDDYNDFCGLDSGDESNYDDVDESMDGDHDSCMTSCGWGTDEDYGVYCGDPEDDMDCWDDDGELGDRD